MTIRFKVEALCTLPSPYKQKKGNLCETIYYLLVDMKELPSLIPMDVNPRKPKMTTTMAKSLLNAVTESSNDFYINNRGIVISAKSLSFNTKNSEITIDLGTQENATDRYQYGILDGGHTYTAILMRRDFIPDNTRKFVRVEVITNVQTITRLVDARNTSLQVSDIALFDLDGKFENIKKAIHGQSYDYEIAYKDNDNKRKHVYQLLRLLYTFDIDKFPDDNNSPIQSYSSKGQVLKRYKDAFETPLYQALINQLPFLVNLFDTIEKEIPIKYNEYKKAFSGSVPRFEDVRGIAVYQNSTTKFLSSPIQYSVPSGYVYPIFGAFRSLLRFESNTLSWLFDPFELWNDVGILLVQNTFETSPNPQLAGKNKQLWLSNYRIVETQSLRKQLQHEISEHSITMKK